MTDAARYQEIKARLEAQREDYGYFSRRNNAFDDLRWALDRIRDLEEAGAELLEAGDVLILTAIATRMGVPTGEQSAAVETRFAEAKRRIKSLLPAPEAVETQG